jgi:hypothetical protein
MPYASCLVDRAFLLRWGDIIEKSDMVRLVAELSAGRDTTGQALVYVGIVPETTKAPAEEVRREMTATLPLLLEHCETVHVVMEGAGFATSIKRSMMTAMMFATGKRGRVFVHDTVQTALGVVAKHGYTRTRDLDGAIRQLVQPSK